MEVPTGVMKGTWVRYGDMNESKRADAIQTTTLSIGGLSCGACVGHVTRALDGLTGVVHVDIDIPKNEAVVEHLLDRVSETGLIAAISSAGYHARVVASGSERGDLVPNRRPRAAPRAVAAGRAHLRPDVRGRCPASVSLD